MLQKFLLAAALVGVALPALAQQQGNPAGARRLCARRAQVLQVANEDTMRVLACLQANRAKIGAACNKVLLSHGQ
jgi:hypothetical protein